MPHKIRRLAALARAGQAWNELPPELQTDYQGWLEAARHSNHPERLLLRLAAHCEAAENLRHEVARSLLYPRLVLLGLALVTVGLGLFLANPWLLLSLALVALAYRVSASSERVWGWLGARRSAELEQLLWCENLAQLLDLDLDLPSACRWASLPVRDGHLRARAASLEACLLQGNTLAQAMKGQSWDPLIQWAALAAEEHGTLAGALHEAANTLESNLEEEVSNALAWLQPVALALVGCLVLLTLTLFWLDYQTLSLETIR